MGLTIHYRGHARGRASQEAILAITERFAARRRWAIKNIDGEEPAIFEALGEGTEGAARPGPVRGIIATPHPDCESLILLFDGALWMRGSTKTQFSPLQHHVELVRLLRELAPHFTDLEVTDEGEYWETGDLATLIARMGFLRNAIDDLARELGAE